MFVFSGVLSQYLCVSGATQAIKNLDDKTVASFDVLLDAFSLVPWSSAGGTADSRSTSLETIDYEEGEMETPKKQLEPGPSGLDMVGDSAMETPKKKLEPGPSVLDMVGDFEMTTPKKQLDPGPSVLGPTTAFAAAISARGGLGAMAEGSSSRRASTKSRKSSNAMPGKKQFSSPVMGKIKIASAMSKSYIVALDSDSKKWKHVVSVEAQRVQTSKIWP